MLSPLHITPQPGLLVLTDFDWSMIEFEGLVFTWLHAEGTYPGSLGSSGSDCKYWSKLTLNSSVLTFVRFLMFFGSELKSLAPWILKLPSLIVLILPEPLALSILTSLPLLSEFVSSSPQFGVIPYRVFQTIEWPRKDVHQGGIIKFASWEIAGSFKYFARVSVNCGLSKPS